VQIAFLGSSKATVDFVRLMLKRLHHTGSMRSRSVPDKAAIARAVEENAWPMLAVGKVRPVMDTVFPFRDAAKAHARMEPGVHIGKIVLDMGAQ
jgi:NADPH2:quinone reductase